MKVCALSISAAGLMLAALGASFAAPVPPPEEVKERATFLGGARGLAFSPDGKTLASAGGDRIVKLWDVATAKETAALEGHTDSVSAVAFSPDGKALASGSYDTTIRLWDVAGSKQAGALKGHRALVDCLAFSPDGKALASGGSQEMVIWGLAKNDVESTTKVPRLVRSTALTYGPGGKLWAVTFKDKESVLALWDVTAGKEVVALNGHTDTVYHVTFSRDGKTLASGGRDKTARLWDVARGKNTATFKYDEEVTSVLPTVSRRRCGEGGWTQAPSLE